MLFTIFVTYIWFVLYSVCLYGLCCIVFVCLELIVSSVSLSRFWYSTENVPCSNVSLKFQNLLYMKVYILWSKLVLVEVLPYILIAVLNTIIVIK